MWDPVTQRIPLALTSVYLLRSAKFLDAYGIIIMFSDPIDAHQLSQDNPILLLDITSEGTKSKT